MDETTSNASALGKDLRRRPERRLLLSASGSVREQGLPTGDEPVLLAGREGGPADPPRTAVIRRTPEGISRVDAVRTAAEEAIKVTPLQNASIPSRRHRCDIQGSARRVQIRPVDRGCRGALPDLRHHAGGDAEFGRRVGDRWHRGAFVGCGVRPLGAGLAAHPRHRTCTGWSWRCR